MLTVEEIRNSLPLAYESSDLPLPERSSGKVRDWYHLPDRRRLIITSDRLSAFDRNLAVVPYKGQVLNQLAAWWFERTKDLIHNHLLSVPDPNASEVMDVEPFPVEVIVRGFITGVTSTALWYRYSLGERNIYGYQFPEGMQKNQQLPQPIITPTTKGGITGHDERLTCKEVVDRGYLDQESWRQIQEAALAIFTRGQEVAQKSGLILVDTKYEFGRTTGGAIVLIDEVHTPDSSRFWKIDSYKQRVKSGQEPENFDKEFIRRHYANFGYRGDGQPPEVSNDLLLQASQRYMQIYEMLTGLDFQAGDYPIEPRLLNNLRKVGFLK